MDSSPFPHPVHSASTSAIPRASLSSPADEPTAGSASHPLHRGYSDTSPSGISRARPAPAASAPDSRDPETWMDFLRGTGADGHPEGQSSLDGAEDGQEDTLLFGGIRTLSETSDAVMADRKRRLTAPESPGRRGGHGPTGTGTATEGADNANGAPGSSHANAIDLTGSPARQDRDSGRPSSEGEAARRGSDIVIPPWQPDSEVSLCPVCRTHFSFWYRKHHCRKCGRVVCSNCSPHRITIPRQYIVRSPDEIRTPRSSMVIDLTDEDADEGSARHNIYNPALGGGEEVRVCNPCVPDPNFSPPPTNASSRFPNFDPRGFQDESAQARFSTLRSPGRSRNFTYDTTHTLGPRGLSSQFHHRPSLSDVGERSTSDPFRNRHVSFQNRSADFFPPPIPPHLSSRGSPSGSPLSAYQPNSSSPFPLFSHHIRPSRSSSASSSPHQPPSRYRSLLDATSPPYSSSMQTPSQPARRQIPEEDECPICHEELPPKGPDGSTVERETHVEECIVANFAGSASHPSPSATLDAAASATAARPIDARSSSLPSSGTAHAESSTRRRRTMQGMLRYRATEKDCIDEKGEPQECIICFEDFQEGDEMGRLECFCKFHRTCIRQWWDTKGDGSCPTHQGSFVLG